MSLAIYDLFVEIKKKNKKNVLLVIKLREASRRLLQSEF